MKSSVLLAVVAALLATASTAGAQPPSINSDAVWKDTAGHEIQAQGGCVLQAGNTFYWYGVEFSGETPKQVNCYSSPDLVNWKYEEPVLTQHVARRVKALYNPATRQYFMFTREGARLGVAAAASPTGPFAWQGASDLPQAVGGGDASAFLDDDGKAYLIYTTGSGNSSGKETIVCAELTPDWTGVARVVQQFADVSYESPCLWKRGGRYYCTASGLKGWYSSATAYCTAPGLQGPWGKWNNISRAMIGPSMLADTCNSQHNMVFEIKGGRGSLFVYYGDRWSQFTHYGAGRQVWLPLEFDGETPVLTWRRPWHPDAARGTFTDELRRYGLWRDPPKKRK